MPSGDDQLYSSILESWFTLDGEMVDYYIQKVIQKNICLIHR